MITPPRILHDDHVTILTRTSGGWPDANGVPTTTTTETAWDGVNVQQVQADELTDQDRETSRTWYRVSGPPAPTPIMAGDRIRWRGTEYRVDGDADTRTGSFRINHTSLRMYAARG